MDFLPSMLAIMGVETAGKSRVEMPHRCCRRGTTPAEWKDITFMRSTGKPGSTAGWISAVTPRYKLILAPGDDPWLLDLETDPDELTNFINSPDHKEVVRHLAQELTDYGKRLSDPYTTNPKTRDWLEKLSV